MSSDLLIRSGDVSAARGTVWGAGRPGSGVWDLAPPRAGSRAPRFAEATPAPHLLPSSAMTRLLMGRLPFHPRDYDKLLIATISRSSLPEISAALWR